MGTVDLTKKTVNLTKGQKINLSKTAENDGLSSVMIGLGWDPVNTSREVETQPGFFGRLFGKKPTTRTVSTGAANIDCDAWLALFDANGELITKVYYGDKTYCDDAVKHHGDNLTGAGDGDDEQISIKLDKLPEKVAEILVGVTIYSAGPRNQSFGMIENLFTRVVDNKDNFEICRFENKDFAGNEKDTNFIAGRFVKENNSWEFEALGTSDKSSSIADAVTKYSRSR
jgi:stress response protein SCP2